MARIFGIRYVLEHASSPGPSGTAFVRRIGDEDLYRVTGVVAPATLTALTASGKDPPAEAPTVPIAVAHRNPATWRITTNSPVPANSGRASPMFPVGRPPSMGTR